MSSTCHWLNQSHMRSGRDGNIHCCPVKHYDDCYLLDKHLGCNQFIHFSSFWKVIWKAEKETVKDIEVSCEMLITQMLLWALNTIWNVRTEVSCGLFYPLHTKSAPSPGRFGIKRQLRQIWTIKSYHLPWRKWSVLVRLRWAFDTICVARNGLSILFLLGVDSFLSQSKWDLTGRELCFNQC